jgi:hypothetical protein
MAAAHRSLRGKRQSRQPPRRFEAGMVGGLCSLERSRWAARACYFQKSKIVTFVLGGLVKKTSGG